MLIAIPEMHEVSGEQYADCAREWIGHSKGHGRVAGENERCHEEHGKNGPKAIFEFLCVMNSGFFVCDEQVETIDQTDKAGTDNRSNHKAC